LPAEYPDDSTVQRAFQRWRKAGVFERLWAELIERCDDLDRVDWEWQAVDGAMGKARKGGAMLDRTRPDRAQGGVKRSLLVDGHGRPLAAVVAAANVPDDRLLEATLEAMVLERPEPDWPQHRCLDAGYDTPTGWETTVDHDDSPHIAPRRPADRPPPAAPP
jgi:putative transposase